MPSLSYPRVQTSTPCGLVPRDRTHLRPQRRRQHPDDLQETPQPSRRRARHQSPHQLHQKRFTARLRERSEAAVDRQVAGTVKS